MKWTIQKKLLVTIIGGGFLFMGFGLYLTYSYVKEALTTAIGANFQEIAKKTAEGFDATVKKEIRPFELLSFDPDFFRALERGDRALLERRLMPYLLHEEEPGVHLALYALDARGAVAGEGRLRPGEPLFQGDQPWWKAVAKGKLYAGTIYHDRSTGRNAFDFAVPVMEPGGKRVVGAVKGVLDTEIFFRFIKEMSFAGTGHGMLLSSDGTPLICSILPLVEHSMNEALIRRIVEGETGWVVAADDAHGGKNSIVGFSPVRFLNSLGPESLGGHQWYAFIRQDPRETVAPVRSVLWKVLLFEGGVIALVGVFGIGVVRRFVLSPLTMLQEGVHQAGKGDLNYRVDIQTHDELEDLAKGFNRMSGALQESYSQLEQKIRDRTRELTASETKYRALMEQAYDAIFLMNPENGNVIEANQQAEKMTGYSREELLAMNFLDFQPDHEAEYAADQFKKAVRRGQAVIHDALFRRKDGEILWVDIRARIIEYDGARVYHSIVRDITDRKREEEKMRTANEQLLRSTQVMLDQDQKLAAIRLEMTRLIQRSSLSEAEKEEVLKVFRMA
ncbi:MAG: PAS domain S-box protein [Nitrospirae bacterium]|nr:PAS domain S-box protein [Nitrospirota bacterium]